MNVVETALQGVKLIEPEVFGDARGYFLESWCHQRYAQQVAAESFVQDNISKSERGVLRGLHLQHPYGQGKLIWVAAGSVYDVAVDVRNGSPMFGKWVAYELSDENHRQLYIPSGFAHGFCVLSEMALFCYKCTEYYSRESEMGVLYSDPDLGIDWPFEAPTLSDKDLKWPRLADIPPERLPRYA
jgi:dTDP-4-dehydrorhamnose 3,5-epimerase